VPSDAWAAIGTIETKAAAAKAAENTLLLKFIHPPNKKIHQLINSPVPRAFPRTGNGLSGSPYQCDIEKYLKITDYLIILKMNRHLKQFNNSPSARRNT
jgi:hypothetical protein